MPVCKLLAPPPPPPSQGWIDRQLYDRIVALLRRARLPLTPPSSMTTQQVGEGLPVEWVSQVAGRWTQLVGFTQSRLPGKLLARTELLLARGTAPEDFGASADRVRCKPACPAYPLLCTQGP